jgi:hypothetical protein
MRQDWKERRSDIIINIDKAILHITESCRFPEIHLVELLEKLVAIKETFMVK